MVDLNGASLAELMSLPDVDERRGHDLLLWRPYVSWEEVENVPGVTPELIARWQSAGATACLPSWSSWPTFSGQACETGR
jgi:hypothetical protein